MLFSLLILSLNAAPLDVVKAVANDRRTVTSGDALAAKLDSNLDVAELSRRALGEQWSKLAKAQQQEFVATLKSLLRATWMQKLLGDDKGSGTVFGKETIEGDEALVATTVDFGGEQIPVEYKLRKSGAAWKIYDVVTDGASLVDLYQAEFKKQMSKGGYDGLLATLKSKVKQQEQTKTTASR